MNIIIYGAQGIALGVFNSIKELLPDCNIFCFMVTEMGDNSSMLGGIPVYELEEYAKNMSQEQKNDVEVLIATPESVMQEIEKSLNVAGFYNVVRIDSLRWAQMVQNAFIKTGEYVPLAIYPVGTHKSDIHVYKMIHEKDKSLLNHYDEPDYMIPLQVGAEHSDRQVTALADNRGDNISCKNGNYSELTGLYWVWKNQLHSDRCEKGRYYGIVHYRRMLYFTEDDLLRIKDNDIDVILPFPMPYEPDIEAHHKRYLSNGEWQAVLCALEELQPEYADAFDEILRQGYMYNYNIVLAKENVLNDYCAWLFPLLARIEQINDSDEVKSQNRYIGYIGETLETLYFMYNKNDLRIAHVGCRFLV